MTQMATFTLGASPFPEAVEDTLLDGRASRSRRNVRGDVVHASGCLSGNRACRRDDYRTSLVQLIDDGRGDCHFGCHRGGKDGNSW
jgi:hypothetical protein